MSETGELINVPKLRFPEFSGTWKQRPFSDFISTMDAGVSVNSGDRPANIDEYGILKTSCVTNGTFDANENKVVWESSEIARLREPVSAGSIIISRMNTPALVGANALVQHDHSNLFLPDRLWSAKVNGKAVPYWLGLVMSDPRTRQKLSDLASGTSGSMKNISKRDVTALQLRVPPLPEQQKIADFLGAVDARVGLLRRRRQALSDYKKAMVQRLFARTLRFTRPDGSPFPDWQEKRLGEVFEERSDRAGEEDELLSVTMRDGIKRLRDLDRTDNSSDDKSNYKSVYIGDIVYNSMRMWQGASGLSPFNGIVSPAYTVITCKLGNVPRFWAYYFKLSALIHTFQRFSQGLTSDTWNLKFPAFAKIKAMAPVDAEEQQKIADFLSALDAKIDAVARQIGAMERFKQGLLQQMFL